MAIDITRLSPSAQAQIAAELSRRRSSERRPMTPVHTVLPSSPAAPRPRGMNRWESLYTEALSQRQLCGEVVWFGYESVRLRLARSTGYTPDFTVILADGGIQFHEVKGFWRDDARVKVKVAAEMYPWAKFIIVTMNKGHAKLETL